MQLLLCSSHLFQINNALYREHRSRIYTQYEI
nr:MAG TPA: hypothetical protein [Caudoviricetes sp.]